MKANDNSRTIEIFKGSPWEVELIKGLLERNNIVCVLKDGIMGTLAPYLAPDVAILVHERDYEAAMVIIREREKNDDET